VRKLSIAIFVLLTAIGAVRSVHAQIDPEKRTLLQFGYNQPLTGRAPLAGYAFYYRNQPNFLDDSNMVLRLALAPVYLDSELGFRNALGGNTDFAVGVAGGGFADSYYEIDRGKFLETQSFTGHDGEVSASVYHLFNPSQRVPLSAVFRVVPHYTVFARDDKTAPNFVLPQDHLRLGTRVGLRLGGREPVIIPEVAMEVSVWYENQYRTGSGTYGFGDRTLKEMSNLYWTRALFIYTKKNHHQFSLSVTAGLSSDVDRFSAYRVGGDLPMGSEFPLVLPGYFYQELSATRFVCFTGEYSLPLDEARHWSLKGIGSMADLDYVAGTAQPGHFNSGVGMGLGYRSSSGMWQVVGTYGYGFEAIRTHGRGGQSIGILCQIDLEARHRAHAEEPLLEAAPERSRGLFRFLQNVF
jgi:hypothetical protein